MFNFEYSLILSMFYVLYQGIICTSYILCNVSRLQFKSLYGYCLPDSGYLTSVFKTCYSLDLEGADFKRQSFQYTWLNSYFFSSLQESMKDQTYLAIRNYLVVGICISKM